MVDGRPVHPRETLAVSSPERVLSLRGGRLVRTLGGTQSGTDRFHTRTGHERATTADCDRRGAPHGGGSEVSSGIALQSWFDQPTTPDRANRGRLRAPHRCNSSVATRCQPNKHCYYATDLLAPARQDQYAGIPSRTRGNHHSYC